MKLKICFPKEEFNFLEMKHLIDICAGEERLTFIHSTLAGRINHIRFKALKSAKFSLPLKKKRKEK